MIKSHSMWYNKDKARKIVRIILIIAHFIISYTFAISRVGTGIRRWTWQWGIELGILHIAAATRCPANPRQRRITRGWIYKIPSV